MLIYTLYIPCSYDYIFLSLLTKNFIASESNIPKATAIACIITSVTSLIRSIKEHILKYEMCSFTFFKAYCSNIILTQYFGNFGKFLCLFIICIKIKKMPLICTYTHIVTNNENSKSKLCKIQRIL